MGSPLHAAARVHSLFAVFAACCWCNWLVSWLDNGPASGSDHISLFSTKLLHATWNCFQQKLERYPTVDILHELPKIRPRPTSLQPSFTAHARSYCNRFSSAVLFCMPLFHNTSSSLDHSNLSSVPCASRTWPEWSHSRCANATSHCAWRGTACRSRVGSARRVCWQDRYLPGRPIACRSPADSFSIRAEPMVDDSLPR